MNKLSKLAGFAFCVLVSVTLTACSTLEQQIPVMSAFSSAPKPPVLDIRSEILPKLPQYRPIAGCDYSTQISDPSKTQSSSQSVVIRPIRARLLVTSTIAGEPSTALISLSGNRLDFNAVDTGGVRLTPDKLSKVSSPSSPQMNNMDLYIPQYQSGPISPGQVASWLRDSSGIVRAAFLYKGLSTFKGRDVVYLEIVQSSPMSKLGRRIGFSIVDRKRALPILFATGGRVSVRAEQLDCRD